MSDKMKTTATNGLNNEQCAAIVKYANTHGRHWKADLNNAWMTGIYSTGDNTPALQQVRNDHGPSWLANINLRALQEQYQRD